MWIFQKEPGSIWWAIPGPSLLVKISPQIFS